MGDESPAPAHSTRPLSRVQGFPQLEQLQHGSFLPAPAPLKMPGRGATAEVVGTTGSPVAPLARGQPKVLPATDGWCCARGSLPVVPRTVPRATGRPGACQRGPTPCHPKAQPNCVVWKPPVDNVTLPGYFRSRTGFLAQKFPDRPPKGCIRNSHAPRPRVSRGLRNHSASEPEKPQRFTAPARPHTAGRLKSRA